MNAEVYSSLRNNVSYLGRLLGETLSDANGAALLDIVEHIRLLSKSARSGNAADKEALQKLLLELPREQLLPVARAFSQFLNLANLADQHHVISREMEEINSIDITLNSVLEELLQSGQSAEAIFQEVNKLNIELVLTAHPTEITRRTLIHKYRKIDACLAQRELSDLSEREKVDIEQRLRELIAQMWHTHDFRCERPTPVDEAKWGFAVVENSLWDAVPAFLRCLDDTVHNATGKHLDVGYAPISFSSWMGGDRDGNPNVTAQVTQQVLLLSRWQAMDLFSQSVEELIEELSMTACSDTFRTYVGEGREPYRVLLRRVRNNLVDQRLTVEACLSGEMQITEIPILDQQNDLWQPLLQCHESLIACGMSTIANGKLLDSLRRVQCFGINLVRLDVRQDSDRHTDALSELTQYLGLGDYNDWDEASRQEFLVSELKSNRPLIPNDWHTSDEVKEVLDTCRVVAAQPEGAIACYVISMARQPSDVLAVELLLKASGVKHRLPVVPLFETLDDLNRAPDVITQLLAIPGYQDHLNQFLMVMIGYSDSAKDAGVLAAAWAQYRAQESMLQICSDAGVKLRLFHGRGGTIGRGGAPAHAALLSQPPGSLAEGLRVTEQGETIRAKLGLKGLAEKTLSLYASAIFRANVHEPPAPSQDWRAAMDMLADKSCDYYRKYVRDNPDFVEYFRQATPEQELAGLPLGSRPARRKAGGGIASLRAIPWIFAWMQNRLMLPAWLGAGQALEETRQELGGDELLGEMARQWPFFETRLSMLAMVFAKADSDLSAYYDSILVAPELQNIGEKLRSQLAADIEVVSAFLSSETSSAPEPWVQESILLRNVYTDPLNILQAELLRRHRAGSDEEAEQALMVTIAGIAAGMRNTG